MMSGDLLELAVLLFLLLLPFICFLVYDAVSGFFTGCHALSRWLCDVATFDSKRSGSRRGWQYDDGWG